MPTQEFVSPDLTCGITTELRLQDDPPHLIVEAIGPESSLRASGLRAGDAIVAIEGTPIPRLAIEQIRKEGPQMPGQYQESLRWQSAGRKEGEAVRLGVRRKQVPHGWQTLEVQGVLRHPRSYRSESNAILLYDGGPDSRERDGFSDAWPSWLETLGKQLRAIACFDRGRPGLTTQYELKTLLEQQPRVKLLLEKYPGPFAQAVNEDFEAGLARMRGTQYPLTERDLAYRRADQERIDAIAAQGRTAWEALVKASESERIPAFPAEHPVYGKREQVAGRCVLLEELSTQKWVSEAGHGWFAAGSDREGWYFLDMEGPGAQRMLKALRRYQRLVSNRIRESYTLLARILPEARILVMNEIGHWGLQVEVQAAWIGAALCIDLRGENAEPQFAGEAGLLVPRTDPPPPDASPEQVLETMIACIQASDIAVWRTLFADWLVRRNADGTHQVCYWMQRVRDDDFERSRASFAGRLFAARVAWTSEPRALTTGQEFPGATRVEEVEAEIEHVGCFDGEYRGFMDVTVNRFWTLQRIDGGPWRIATLQAI
jgi:hypothetical protein